MAVPTLYPERLGEVPCSACGCPEAALPSSPSASPSHSLTSLGSLLPSPLSTVAPPHAKDHLNLISTHG